MFIVGLKLDFFFFWVKVHERYVMRLRKRVQFEERRQANQRRVCVKLLGFFVCVFYGFYVIV